MCSVPKGRDNARGGNMLVDEAEAVAVESVNYSAIVKQFIWLG
jgi:hypothetical protein